MMKNADGDAKLKSMDSEKDRISQELNQMDSEVDDLTRKFDDISQWLEQNDNTNKQIDLDAVTEPKDPLSKQLLYLVAEDATIEDTLYYLEKALGNRALELDVFLKAVRSLANEQFIKRATIKKVHEKQRGL